MDNLENGRLLRGYFAPEERDAHLKQVSCEFWEIDADWVSYVPYGIVDIWSETSLSDRSTIAIMAMATQLESEALKK